MRCALALVAVALASLVASASGRGGAAETCPGAPSFTCATLTVPLDHRSGKGALKLAYAVQTGSAPRGTVLFLTGGPGQPGVAYVNRIADRLGAAFAGYRLVMFDQRGTGPRALQCPALQQQMGSTDLTVPTRAAVTACAAKLGPARRFYSTAQTVEDIEALRRAMGVDKLVLDGVSYGTFVAERYALAHADHVSKLVLDSVVPHDGEGLALETANMHRVAAALGAATAKDIAKVVARRANGPMILNALVTMSVAEPTYTGVAAAFRSAARGSDTQLDALLDRWQADHGTPAEALSQGLHAATLCADLPMPWGSSAAPLARRAAAVKRAVARVKPAALFPFDRATAAGNGILKTCLYWPPTPAPAVVRRKLANVPALLLAGERDLSTPLPWAQRELRLLARGRLVRVSGAGHSVQLRAVNDAGRAAVQAFLIS